MRRFVSVTCVLLFATAAVAGSGGGLAGHRRLGGHMDRNLFPPELVLRNQLALGLSEEQVDAIKKLVGGTQTLTLNTRVSLNRLTEELNAALESPTVDEAAALKLASQAMHFEQEVKTAHLKLMIRVKNLLTEAQQDKARDLKRERRQGPPDEVNE